MDALEIGEIARHDGDEIIVFARHQMTGHDRGSPSDRLLEGFEQILVLAPEADVNDDRHGEAQSLAVDARLVALNDSPLLQRADAPGDGGGRKRNALGEIDLALAAVLEQRPENRTIQRVQLDLHSFPSRRSSDLGRASCRERV